MYALRAHVFAKSQVFVWAIRECLWEASNGARNADRGKSHLGRKSCKADACAWRISSDRVPCEVGVEGRTMLLRTIGVAR